MLKRLATLALIPAAAFLGLLATAEAAQAAPVSTSTLQTQVVALSNQQRAKAGCQALKVNPQLLWAARGHSKYMASTGVFSHTGARNSTFITRVKAAGYSAPRSENIAWGYRSAAEVVNAWMKSPGHRRNLLDCGARTFAVGVVYSTNGTPYYTQEFGSR
ncbi:CAP domain-containing protein [Actinoplanes sp. N902-109]|uniref:CAP domain-containing protein n=1 Tax=Actinoplanes sp. (strain N902-109) TaxID=649831 RepID=UPI0003294ECF|nr:CAP domain-containing protein [Actinoplanes sp. N902-109]AGL20396.1 SCP-like extracellular [Actinoplanes sp. N902-109]